MTNKRSIISPDLKSHNNNNIIIVSTKPTKQHLRIAVYSTLKLSDEKEKGTEVETEVRTEMPNKNRKKGGAKRDFKICLILTLTIILHMVQ